MDTIKAQRSPISMYKYNTDTQKNQDILQEFLKRKAQQRLYAPKLISAISTISHIAQSTADSIYKCGSYIAISPQGHITGANFCRHRFCPICQWRASRKIYGQLMQMYDYVQAATANFALLTLTARNSKALQDGVEQIYDGLHRFINDRRIKKSIIGYMRTLEITYNKSDQTWHPHIHMILALHPDYYNTTKSLYISQEEYEIKWRRAIKATYFTQVDIRAINDNVQGAIAEVAKYAIKPSSVLTSHTEIETIRELIAATYHRRLRSFGGIFRDAAKIIGVQAEPVDLISDKPSELDRQYIYTNGRYIPIDLTPEKTIYDQLIKPINTSETQQTCNCCTFQPLTAGKGA